jgi:GT2 family glycosyltransferase
MSQQHIEVAIIILTLNQRDTTLRCLASLHAARTPPSRVLLWDNGSTDATREAVATQFPDVLVDGSSVNLGVAGGRNAAAGRAIAQWRPQYLLFLDNDMTVAKGFLEALTQPFTMNEGIGQTTGKIMDGQSPSRFFSAGGAALRFWSGFTGYIGSGEQDEGQYDEPRECIATGGCMMVKTAVFERLGGFDETFNPYIFEDVDFGFRLREAGFTGMYAPQAVVFHESRSSRTGMGGHYSEAYARQKARTWFILMRRHASVAEKTAFALVGVPWSIVKLLVRECTRGSSGAMRGAVSGWLASLTGTGRRDA